MQSLFSLEISHGSPYRYDGLGNVLPPQQSLDIWLQAAGMDWTIEQSDVMFNVASDELHMGLELASSRNTAWGLVNSVTEYVDHHRRARSQDHRLDSAWFGQGAQLKSQALNQALTLLQ